MDRGDHGFAGSPAARHQPGRGSAKARAGVTGGRLPRAARYANEAALRFYLLHEPVIVTAAGLIVRWHAPNAGKYAALDAGVACGSTRCHGGEYHTGFWVHGAAARGEPGGHRRQAR